jgi:DNA-binding response OmpR family regulator
LASSLAVKYSVITCPSTYIELKVFPAESFARARSLLAKQAFDLVLLDLDLPDRPGLDLLPLLAGEGHSAGPPVIVFSATEVSRELADEVYQALVKSQTSNEELLAAVLSAIETLPKPQEVV